MSGSLADFFERFTACFEEAAERSPSPAESRIIAGGKIFRLRFATREMQEILLTCLQHLVLPPGHAGPDDFTLNIWDSASTGVQPPRSLWDWTASASKGEIAGLTGPRFLGHVNHESGALSLCDVEARAAIFWMADIARLRGYERAAPFLQIFQWSFQQMGLQAVHAAGIGIPSGAALLAGKSGSGKSTTAALAHEGGLLYMGDDYCLLGDGPPRVFSFYCSMKLHPRSLALAPLARHSGEAAWISDEKNVLLVRENAPGQLPLKMILIPHLTGAGRISVRRATPGEALRALAPSSLFQLPCVTQQTFSFFARLTRQLPAFHFDIGGNPADIASRIRELLEQAEP